MDNGWTLCTGKEQFKPGLYALYQYTGNISVRRCEEGEEGVFPQLKRKVVAFLELPEPTVIPQEKAEIIRLNAEIEKLKKEKKEELKIRKGLIRAIRTNDRDLAIEFMNRCGE